MDFVYMNEIHRHLNATSLARARWVSEVSI